MDATKGSIEASVKNVFSDPWTYLGGVAQYVGSIYEDVGKSISDSVKSISDIPAGLEGDAARKAEGAKMFSVEGEVVSVSNDAIEDEKHGPIYSSRIRLLKSSIEVNGKDVSLSAGMAVTAEVETDRRRVIDYFLSPLKKYVGGSLGGGD